MLVFPPGSAPAAGDTVMAGQAMTIEYDVTPVQPLASVAVTSKFDVPAVVGVPEIVAPVRLSPAGSEPEVTANVYGPVPPVALTSWL